MDARFGPSAHERTPATLPGPPERPEPPSNTKPLVFVLVMVGVLGLFALNRCQGKSATISARGIGPLEIGRATKTEMQDWAVGPVRFWLADRADLSPPVHFKGWLWQYECLGKSTTIFGAPCRTLFGLRSGRVVTVETNNPRFYTAAGTHIGTSLPQALERERGKWSGWTAKCPHFTLPAAKGTLFLATASRNSGNPKGFVTGFYLSKKPASFAFCDSARSRDT